MFIKIPFESEIEFKTNISEITKMSLEHDFNVNEGSVLGNFYVSGEYRSHPVSVNTDSFNYTLPFTVELSDDIDLNTIEFNIEDFSYDVVDNNKLKVNIEYSVKGDVKELDTNPLDNFERVDDSTLESELEYIDSFLDNEKKGEEKNEETEEDDGRDKEQVESEKKEELTRNMEENESTIMNTIKDSDDTFVTYHIHVVSMDETLDSICKKYNVPQSIVSEYNSNIDSISIGDKILIPEIDE